MICNQLLLIFNPVRQRKKLAEMKRSHCKTAEDLKKRRHVIDKALDASYSAGDSGEEKVLICGALNYT